MSPKKKKAAPPDPRGLDARKLTAEAPPAGVEELARAIEGDGGTALAMFRDPLGGHWQILAGLPVDRVEPTPYQRDLSKAHVERLTAAIDKLDRYLDPVIAVRTDEGKYWTPNGYHRSESVKALGGRSITALVVPEREVAHRILLLNTEKAHNLRERALEVIRLAEALAELDPRPERDFEAEFEEPALLTLGLCYQERERAAKLLKLEDAVNEAVAALKEQGLESPYLKAFVVARVNPLRFRRGATADFDETLEKMLRAAETFETKKIRADQLARSGGPAEE